MLFPARFPLAVGLVLALSAPAALAQTVDGSDPAQLVQILQNEGYRAKLEKDNVGDPKIVSSSQGVDWSIFFYDCTDGMHCASIQFSIGFNTENGVPLELMNGWNKENRYARAFVDDEKDPFLKFDVNLDGGVNKANFVDTLTLWETLLADFMKHINW